MNPKQLINTFPYHYVAGGYYREKDVEKGVPADSLHGNEIITAVVRHVLAALKEERV